MIIQDNFSGTESVKKIALELGHECKSLDNDPQFNADRKVDFLEWNGEYCDYAHFSIPCTGMSVASIGKHWNPGYKPKSETSKMAIKLMHRVAWMISEYKYPYYTIENPRGMFRKLMPDIMKYYGINDFRLVTVTYCQYGYNRMKPTDFITNIPGWIGKMCKNGDTCHEAAPRGSRTGTQGLKNAKLRGKIPPDLVREIFYYIHKDKDT